MPPQFSCVPLRSTSENCAVLPCFLDFLGVPTAHFLTFPLFHILWAPFLLKSNNFCKNLTSLFVKIFFYGRRDKYFWKAYERQKASRSYNLEAFWLPRGIRTFPALRLVGRPNGNLCSALPHAELFNAWMLKANRLRWPSRIRLKIYIRIAWIFLPLSRNVIHYC